MKVEAGRDRKNDRKKMGRKIRREERRKEKRKEEERKEERRETALLKPFFLVTGSQGLSSGMQRP